MHRCEINTNLLLLTFSPCKILIASCEILIIPVISDETTKKLTIYAKISQKVTLFYRQEIASLFQVRGKLTARENSK